MNLVVFSLFQLPDSLCLPLKLLLGFFFLMLQLGDHVFSFLYGLGEIELELLALVTELFVLVLAFF